MKLKKMLQPVILSLALLLVLASAAIPGTVHAAYTPQQNTDLSVDNGNGKTLSVMLLNLTPYKMTFIGQDMNFTGIHDTDPNKAKSFAFAPVGVPSIIPAAAKTPRPYPMVFAFTDNVNNVESYLAQWKFDKITVLDFQGLSKSSDNVILSLNIHRNDKDDAPSKAGLFKAVAGLVKDVVKLAVESENPLVWLETFSGAAEVAKEGANFSKENAKNQQGQKTYVSAYVLPEGDKDDTNNRTRPGATIPPGVKPDASRKTWADDAVIVEQADLAGSPQASIVVSTQVLRTQDTARMMVTVMTSDQYTATAAAINLQSAANLGLSKSGSDLHKALSQQGIQAKKQLHSLIQTMTPAQKTALLAATQAILAGKQPTADQEAHLVKVAAAMAKHAKTL